MSTTATHSPASSGQTWALKCAVGLDCRNAGLSYDEAADILDRLGAPETFDAALNELQERGATGTPKLPKAIREANHKRLFDNAWAAGVAAAEACTPTPMIVVERENPLDDNSPVKHQYAPVTAGVCGFAWVTVFPGNSSFARWLASSGRGRKAYKGGMEIWISDYDQSYERKTAHAAAMAQAFRDAGIKAYSGGRLD